MSTIITGDKGYNVGYNNPLVRTIMSTIITSLLAHYDANYYEPLMRVIMSIIMTH